MSAYQESIGDCGLHCFGSISASISHELKNTLAIINENAGLLEDLSLMAEKGRPLDPVRLKSLAANIGKQIQRADGIIRNMNRFAHSTDEPVNCIDLGDTLALTVALSSRFAAMKSITLNFIPPPQPVFVTTRLFYIENLIWLCLKEIFERAGVEKEITLSLRSRAEGAAVIFSPVDAPVTNSSTINLLDYMKAAQSADSQDRELTIMLPADMTVC
ncbi:MAG: HAMP domain-containing histidine kinase [Deltaproteobacteria bacterium]|nr:HAMP domain-containing histidine kinase [Deltaproteobacteria bacterium]